MREDIPTGQRRGGAFLHGKTEEDIREFFRKEFGIGLEGYYITVGRKRAYVSTAPPFGKGVTGIPLCRIGKGIKPTSYAIQVLGRMATRRVVPLSMDKAMEFIEGYDVSLQEDVGKMGNGYVIVAFGSDVLGVGYLRDGMIENLLPKAMRRKILVKDEEMDNEGDRESDD